MNEKKLYLITKSCMLLFLLFNFAIYLKFVMIHKYLLSSLIPHVSRIVTFALLFRFENIFLFVLFLVLDCTTLLCSEYYTLVFEKVLRHRLKETYSVAYVTTELILNAFTLVYAYIFIKRARYRSDVLPVFELTNVSRL